jgi:hypothetical protein
MKFDGETHAFQRPQEAGFVDVLDIGNEQKKSRRVPAGTFLGILNAMRAE